MGDTTSDASNFGTLLQQLREAAGLSQAQLAERAGMNVFGVAKLEQGQREPSWATVQSLAAALGVSCTEFTTAPGSDAPADAPREVKPAKEEKPAPKKATKGKKT